MDRDRERERSSLSHPGLRGGWGAGKLTYGWFSEAHVLNFLPDPGALNSCMHAFPEKSAGSYCGSTMYLDMGFETLDPRLSQ